MEPSWRFPVTTNDTPYSRCLSALAGKSGDHLPVIAVGEIADKTGQLNTNERGYALSQGASEMVMSAFFKTGKVRLVERLDLRVANQELNFRKGKLVGEPLQAGAMRGSDFVVVGALTELNYNIVSDGAGLWVYGIGAGVKGVVVNVALDLRVISSRTLDVVYVSSLQKQIIGREVEANIFRFFDATLVELDAGQIRNEPLQLGVRSVAEMAVHQVMTDFLGLPASRECRLVVDGTMARKPLTTIDQGE
ncbi:MAG TPA: CsgG/HfaB family protein [Stellaceae bacterium]|nr:CsgG/HfaB family protein [Stellaceae bacterium]